MTGLYLTRLTRELPLPGGQGRVLLLIDVLVLKHLLCHGPLLLPAPFCASLLQFIYMYSGSVLPLYQVLNDQANI